MPQSLDQDAVNLAKAIRQTESGGDFAAKGRSGEFGAYQYTRNTWAKDAAMAGVVSDLDKATKEEQNKVAYMRIKAWKDKGYNVGQIASMWNAGEGEPDAYLGKFSNGQPSSGVNSFGVGFNVPAYAKSVSTAYHTIKGGGNVYADPSNPSSVVNPQNKTEEGLSGKLIGRINQANDAITADQNIGSKALQVVGAGAGAVGDVIGAGIGLIPGMKKVEEFIGKGVSKVAGTPAGQKAMQGYQNFKEAHPEAARNINAVGNIATLASGGIGGKVATAPLKEGLVIAAKDIAKEGLATTIKGGVGGVADRAAANIAKSLLESTPTLSEVKAGVRSGRVGAGVLQTDPFKQASIDEVKNLVRSGEITKKTAPSDAAAIIKQAADSEAESMRNLIRNQEVQGILDQSTLKEFSDSVLKKSGKAVTSGEKPAETLLQVFYENLPKGKTITTEDVLNARQAVSNFVLENRGDWSVRGVMTGFKNARDAFWDESRELLARLEPKVPIKESLKKQSSLYRALDYISPTVKKELTKAKETFTQRHPLLTKGVKYLGSGALMGLGYERAAHLFKD